jgi:hypothetical protein
LFHLKYKNDSVSYIGSVKLNQYYFQCKAKVLLH